MSEIPKKKLKLTEAPQSIWHIPCIMDTICDNLAYEDLKTFRLVNTTFLEMSSCVFLNKTMIHIVNECLHKFNESYTNSNLKNVTAVRFEGYTTIVAFEAFFGLWQNVTQVALKYTKFFCDEKNEVLYELPKELMKHVKTLICKFSGTIIRTSAIPAIERLDICNREQVILDGPISLIHFMSFDQDFVKNGNILSPSQWPAQPELDFTKLKSLTIYTLGEMGFTFSIENFLELEYLKFMLLGPLDNGSRVIGWHNNLKIREISLSGLIVDILELPPSIRICNFEVCRFIPSSPKNLKTVAIRTEYPIFFPSIRENLFDTVNLSGCTHVRTLSLKSTRLNTSFLPSSLQCLRIMIDCEIVGDKFAVPTLIVYNEHNHRYTPNFQDVNHYIDEISKHFTYNILLVDCDNVPIYMASYSSQFLNLLKELDHQGIITYLNGIYDEISDEKTNLTYYEGSNFSKLVDRFAHCYEFRNGRGMEISKNPFFDNSKF